MKLSKSEFETLIREGVQSELGSLNEEELNELWGGLSKLFSKGKEVVADTSAKAQRAVVDTAKNAKGALGNVGSAIGKAATKAGKSIKDTFEEGEREAALKKAMAEIDIAVKNKADSQAMKTIKGLILKALRGEVEVKSLNTPDPNDVEIEHDEPGPEVSVTSMRNNGPTLVPRKQDLRDTSKRKLPYRSQRSV